MNGNGVSRRFFLTTAVAAGGGLLIGPWLDAELPGATSSDGWRSGSSAQRLDSHQPRRRGDPHLFAIGDGARRHDDAARSAGRRAGRGLEPRQN